MQTLYNSHSQILFLILWDVSLNRSLCLKSDRVGEAQGQSILSF